AVPALADQDSLRRAIDKAREEDHNSLVTNTNYDQPKSRAEKVVAQAVLASGDPKVVLAAVAKELAISTEAAAPLIEGFLKQDELPLERTPEVAALIGEPVPLPPPNFYVLSYPASAPCQSVPPGEFGNQTPPLVHDLSTADIDVITDAMGG